MLNVILGESKGAYTFLSYFASTFSTMYTRLHSSFFDLHEYYSSVNVSRSGHSSRTWEIFYSDTMQTSDVHFQRTEIENTMSIRRRKQRVMCSPSPDYKGISKVNCATVGHCHYSSFLLSFSGYYEVQSQSLVLLTLGHNEITTTCRALNGTHPLTVCKQCSAPSMKAVV